MPLTNYLASCSPVELNYQLDEQALQRIDLLKNAFQRLSTCHRVWNVGTVGSTHDWKRNAGASSLVGRTAARVGFGTPRSFRANVDVAHLVAGRDTLYFLPDLILVNQSGAFGSISYESLEAAWSSTRFIENESVPSDSQVVGTTWRYVNKSGGPDRRFKDNRQLPVVVYGEIGLASPTGLRVALMTSTVDAAKILSDAIHQVQSIIVTPMLYLSGGLDG